MASIQGIYIALFGRPADPAGLAFFNEETDNGADLTAIGDLAASAEYQSRFEGLDNIQIINSIYQSLFGRDADLAGLNFFAAELAAGRQTINTIAINIFDGAQGDDALVVANKVEAANLFTASIDTGAEVVAYRGEDASDAGRAFLAPITSDDATVPTQAQADAAVKAIVDNAPIGNEGGTFSLTPGVDYADNAGSIKNGGLQPSDFTFTSKNDTVIANAATLTATDILIDNSTTDQDVLKYTGATLTQFAAGLAVQNIETFDITLASATNSAADFSAVTGLKTVDVHGSLGAGQTAQFANFDATGVSLFDTADVTGGLNSQVVIADATANQDITVTGGAVNTFVFLGNGDNSITTGAGNDQISLGGGDNTVVTGAGNNQVALLAGDNTVTFGAGDDTLSFGNGANTVILGDGVNTVNSGGANGNNSITGGAGVDTIFLGNGTNTIVTAAGNDAISVGTGTNSITAGAGADAVTLGAGGVNTLFFVTGDSPATAGSFDSITGFEVGGAGKDLLDFDGPAGVAGNFIGSNAGTVNFASALVAAQAQFDGDVTTAYFTIDDTVNTWVFADTNLDNVIDYAVQLTGIAAAETVTFGSFV